VTDAENLASEITAAMAGGTVEQLLAARLHDPVSVHHDPPLPTDGPMPAASFGALLTGNPMSAMIPDGVRTYGATKIDDHEISFESVLRGTMTDGQPITIANVTVLTEEAGRIIKLVQRYPAEALAALMTLAPPTQQ
jgi:hypothetical protein